MKKIVSTLLIFTLIFGSLSQGINSSHALSLGAASDDSYSMSIGDYVTFGSYNGQPILWRVIDIDQNKSLLLFSESILSLKAFDAAGERHTDSERISYGGNRWETSTLRQWLNSSNKEVAWLKNPPNEENIWLGHNPYAEESGFLSTDNFSMADSKAIQSVTHKTIITDIDKDKAEGMTVYSENVSKPHVFNFSDLANYQRVTDKVFLLSIKELKSLVIDRGFSFEAKPTYSAVTENDFKNEYIDVNKYWNYWVIHPSIHVSTDLAFADRISEFSYGIASSGVLGVRPALYVDSNSIELVSGSGSKSSPYAISGNGNPAGPTIKDDLTLENVSTWALNEVTSAYDKRLIPSELLSGYKNPITRSEFAHLLVNLYEIISGKQIPDPINMPFTDTSDPFVTKAYNLKIVSGKGNGLFEPDTTISRQEIAVMFYNLIKALDSDFSEEEYPSHFYDTELIADWALNPVNYMFFYGVIGGLGNGTFDPLGHATREQAYMLTLRVHNLLKSN